MKIKKIFLAAVVATMTVGPIAEAAEVLRFAEFGPNRGWRENVHAWLAEEVKKRTNGELEVQSTFGGALVKPREVLRGVGDGLADMGTIVGVYTPQQMVNYRVGDIPTGNDDAFTGLSAMYEVASTHPTLKADFDKQNLVYIGNFTSSTVILACKNAVTKLSDLDGLKVRANPPHADVFREAGAVIVAMPFPEVYQALDKGNIDCAQTYWTAMFAYKHHEVAKQVTALKWSQNMGFGVVMNKDRFNELKPEHQKVMREIGYDMTMLAAKLAIAGTAKLKGKIGSDPTVTINELGAAEQEALIAAGLKTADGFKGDKSVLDAYLAAAKKYEAVRSEKGYPWAN